MRQVTKEEAEEIISANRHNELKSVLKQIAFYLSSEKNDKNDKDVVDEIRKQSHNIEHFFKSIESNQNSKELVSSFNKMREDILASNERLVKTIENRLLPDTFDLIRNDGNDRAQSVKVNYKEASKIHITIKN